MGVQDLQCEREWQYEKARQALLTDEPNVDPTPEQVAEKMAQLHEPLDWYLEQVERQEREVEEEEELEAVAGDDRFGRAVERLCVIWGQPWRAATLIGGDLSHDPVLAGYNRGGTTLPALPEAGNRQHRMLWRSMCLQLAEQAARNSDAMGTSGMGEQSINAYEQRRHHKGH